MCNNACGLNDALRVQSGMSETCNGVERDPSLFLTNPQPPEPGCHDCLVTDDFASLTVADARASEPLLAATIDILDETTGRHYLYAVDPTMLSNSFVTEVELPLGAVVPRTAHIELTFANADMNTRDPMIVR